MVLKQPQRGRTSPRSTRWSDREVLDHLVGLTDDDAAVELVGALCSGSRASFTVAEAADLLSVSAKHLYAVIKSQGHIAPGLDVIRSGDRMIIPAHQLRAFLKLPEPHIPGAPNPIRLDAMSPELLGLLVRDLSFLIVTRLYSSGAIAAPDEDSDE
jgi:hypothetical protein